MTPKRLAEIIGMLESAGVFVGLDADIHDDLVMFTVNQYSFVPADDDESSVVGEEWKGVDPRETEDAEDQEYAQILELQQAYDLTLGSVVRQMTGMQRLMLIHENNKDLLETAFKIATARTTA